MDEATQIVLEGIMNDYATKKITAKQLQKAVQQMGFTTSLRGKSSTLDVYDNDTGKGYQLSF